jgi:hypothetical protein
MTSLKEHHELQKQIDITRVKKITEKINECIYSLSQLSDDDNTTRNEYYKEWNALEKELSDAWKQYAIKDQERINETTRANAQLRRKCTLYHEHYDFDQEEHGLYEHQKKYENSKF